MFACSIVFWKKLYCFEEDLWWNTFQNTGDLLEDFDVEHSFEILFTAKKNNASVFRAIRMKKIFISREAKKNFLCFFSVYL